jgi:hypothetical protein
LKTSSDQRRRVVAVAIEARARLATDDRVRVEAKKTVDLEAPPQAPGKAMSGSAAMLRWRRFRANLEVRTTLRFIRIRRNPKPRLDLPGTRCPDTVR